MPGVGEDDAAETEVLAAGVMFNLESIGSSDTRVDISVESSDTESTSV